jgi:signal-transduction protein with cAMP-binding, CBS, and nucleotidyltransferase domain
MRTVKDIIDSKPKPANVIRPTALVIDALHLLDAVNLSYLIVKDGETYKGIFSERDYSRNVLLKGRSSTSALLQDVMTIDLPEVTLTDTVEYCMDLMARAKARYLVVFTGLQFEGVITIHDLLRQVIANREKVFDDALAQQLIDTAESGGSRIY